MQIFHPGQFNSNRVPPSSLLPPYLLLYYTSPMPLDPHHSRVAKRSTTVQKILPVISGAVTQSVLTALHFLSNSAPTPRPMCTSTRSGHQYIHEVMNCGNPKRIQEVLRMKLEVFQFLCSELKSKGGLAPSRFMTVEEQVAMFLWTVARAASNCDVQEHFQHSGETISRYFHLVLHAINRLVPEYIKLPTIDSEIPTAITSNPKFYNFFNNCIGAFDGTHIAAKVPNGEASAFRNHKGTLSQNVFAACELDNLLFSYVLAGWEGSAHDGAVLEAAFDTGFSVPVGKYYLGDAGFALTPWCLTPYRGVRYHLREWSKSQDR